MTNMLCFEHKRFLAEGHRLRPQQKAVRDIGEAREKHEEGAVVVQVRVHEQRGGEQHLETTKDSRSTQIIHFNALER